MFEGRRSDSRDGCGQALGWMCLRNQRRTASWMGPAKPSRPKRCEEPRTFPATLKRSAEQRLIRLVQVTPAKAPVGNTNVLVGLVGANGAFGVQAIPLVDAPEGGTCHP